MMSKPTEKMASENGVTHLADPPGKLVRENPATLKSDSPVSEEMDTDIDHVQSCTSSENGDVQSLASSENDDVQSIAASEGSSNWDEMTQEKEEFDIAAEQQAKLDDARLKYSDPLAVAELVECKDMIIEDLEGRIGQSRADFRDLNQAYWCLYEKDYMQSQMVDAITGQNEVCMREIDALKEEKDLMAATLQKEEEEKAKKKALLDDKVGDLQTKMAFREQSFNRERTQLKGEIKVLKEFHEKETVKHGKEICALQDELSSNNENYLQGAEKLRLKFEGLRNELVSIKEAHLGEIKQLKGETEVLQTELTASKEAHSEEKRQFTAEVEKLQAKLLSDATAFERDTRKLMLVVEACRNQSARDKKAHSTEKELLQNTINDHLTQINGLLASSEETKQLKSVVANARITYAQLKAEVSTLQNKLTLDEKAHATKEKKLEKELMESTAMNIELKRKIETLNSCQEGSQLEVNRLRSKVTEGTIIIANLKDEVRKQQTAYSSEQKRLLDEIQRLEDTLAEQSNDNCTTNGQLKGKIANLDSTLGLYRLELKFRATITRNEETIAKLKNEAEELQTKSAADEKRYTEKIQRLTNENARHENTIKELQSKSTSDEKYYMEEKQRLEAVIAERTKMNLELRGEVQKLHPTLASREKAHAEALKLAELENGRLTEQLRAFHERIIELQSCCDQNCRPEEVRVLQEKITELQSCCDQNCRPEEMLRLQEKIAELQSCCDQNCRPEEILRLQEKVFEYEKLSNGYAYEVHTLRATLDTKDSIHANELKEMEALRANATKNFQLHQEVVQKLQDKIVLAKKEHKEAMHELKSKMKEAIDAREEDSLTSRQRIRELEEMLTAKEKGYIVELRKLMESVRSKEREKCGLAEQIEHLNAKLDANNEALSEEIHAKHSADYAEMERNLRAMLTVKSIQMEKMEVSKRGGKYLANFRLALAAISSAFSLLQVNSKFGLLSEEEASEFTSAIDKHLKSFEEKMDINAGDSDFQVRAIYVGKKLHTGCGLETFRCRDIHSISVAVDELCGEFKRKVNAKLEERMAKLTASSDEQEAGGEMETSAADFLKEVKEKVHARAARLIAELEGVDTVQVSDCLEKLKTIGVQVGDILDSVNDIADRQLNEYDITEEEEDEVENCENNCFLFGGASWCLSDCFTEIESQQLPSGEVYNHPLIPFMEDFIGFMESERGMLPASNTRTFQALESRYRDIIATVHGSRIPKAELRKQTFKLLEGHREYMESQRHEHANVLKSLKSLKKVAEEKDEEIVTPKIVAGYQKIVVEGISEPSDSGESANATKVDELTAVAR